MSFDPTKPVQTRDGRKARILTTNLKATSYTLAAAVICFGEEECIYTLLPNGRIDNAAESRMDLINIPEKTIRFVNVYPGNGSNTLEEAKRVANVNSTGTLEVTIVDGKLIDVIVHQ